ncbi:sirohydrochlorin chelatase [Streptomyces zaomyceticus]|uniref:sirohydrochlorin chelatase n=1 Tax=Streptomyces zaomyceticus TaxID=68286 RepID=UPI0032494A90
MPVHLRFELRADPERVLDQDLPEVPGPAAARRFDCAGTRGLSGEHAVSLALYDRLRAAERKAGGPADAVVVAGAGSSRPGGNDGTLAAVRRLGLLLPVPVTAAYCSSSTPTPAEAVARLHALGFRRVAVATHLLAPGRFTRALAALYAGAGGRSSAGSAGLRAAA